MTAVDRTADARRRGPEPTPRDPGRSTWRAQWWVLLLAVYCIGFVISSFPRFVLFDESRSAALPPRPQFPYQYPLLAWHVLFGSVAMVLAWIQVWPWFRDHHRLAHRRIGWVYFLFGTIPAGVLAVPVAVLSSAGQSLRMALLSLSVLWLTSTFMGLRAVLQGRYADHQRWMYRNVALTTSIITARPIFLANFYGLSALLPDTYPTEARHTFTESYSTGIWLSVIVHLAFVEWFVLRPRRRVRRGTRSASPEAVAPVATAGSDAS